eukprot:253438_1
MPNMNVVSVDSEEPWKDEIQTVQKNKYANFLIPRRTDFSGIDGSTLCPSSAAKWTQSFTVSRLWRNNPSKGTLIAAKHVSLREPATNVNNRYKWMRLFSTMRYFGLRGLSNIAYPVELYGKKSFFIVAHIRDLANKQFIADAIVMNVAFDYIKRKSRSVDIKTQELINNTWNNDYPQNMKHKYKNLKNTFVNNMEYLKQNIFKNNKNKLLFSYKIALRYMDQDPVQHLNQSTYFHYVEEGLFNYFFQHKKNKYVVFQSMTALYKKEISLRKHDHCFVNLWHIKSTHHSNVVKYCGSVDIKHNNQWDHHCGFVMTVLNSNRSKL